MKKQRWTFEILAILVVAALLTWFVQEREPDAGIALAPDGSPKETLTVSETEDLKKQWADHYAIAQQFLEEKKYKAAKSELLTAHMIAVLLPAGDKSLAETLDDLGQVYFRMGKPGRAREYQGRAVAALLLAGGPQDPELDLYIKRYGWAHAEFARNSAKAFALIEEPHEFLAAFAPLVPPERFAQELAMLESDYQKMGHSEGLAVIAQFRQIK